MTRDVTVYRSDTGREPFSEYVDALRDRVAVSRIRLRVTRAKLGNFGDHRTVGRGVIELRIDHGPGYRIYVGLHGDEVIVLLCAGSKSSQRSDIVKAWGYWEDFKRQI
ncbi:MAG: type II toxin-antitoxin system RelE/ParE family toxin [Elusimicrobiales bacterium]|nr:type II toxin-antitoxin system RelE/ParE family toxin [Elusimicrobiales bacterium]